MQLSSKARKAVAAGLAASTVLWASVLGLAPLTASASVHSEGCLVLSGGIVWMITNGTRRGYTSAEVFQSYGFNFSQVVQATAEDVALPVGPIMIYADSTLVKGPNDPLVYLVSGGSKRPFVSGSVFTGLGYSFSNIQQAPVNTFSDLPTGANLDSATMAHPNGALVISNGAIWQMTATGRMGFPSMAAFNSFGYKLSAVVNANAADLAMPNVGDVAARPTCSLGPVVSGSVNVSLAGPASSTLINDQSQATLADFAFSGTGTVTSVSLKRIGISADTSINNVYLFDGSTRITDAASVSSGSMINFTNSAGLFVVNGSKTISVKADMAATSGETIGIQLTSASLASGSVGGTPISGNLHTVATASLADVNLASALTISDTDPGMDIVVFQGNASVTTRDVNLTRLAVRQIGSINSGDIKNFRLYVDGVLVSTVASLDANGYVTFNVSKTLTTGTRVLKIVADVVGGSGRNVQMSLRGAYDITVVDTQYNASPIVTATGSFPFGDSTTFSINAGTVTVAKASDSPSSNVTVGASDVPLGRWTVTAFGEPVKVETLTVAVDTTGGTTSAHTLRNGRVMINGSQYGSTTSVAAVDSFASGQSFTVNYTVNPGSPVTVEFRADMYDNEGDDNFVTATTISSVQAALFGSASLNNAIPQVSLGTLDVPGATVNANNVTVASGTISLTRLASYPNQTTAVPQTAYKLGSWTLNGNSAEAVNINTFSVGFAGTDAFDANADLTNVYIKYGPSTSTIKGTVTTGSSTNLANTWSQSATLGVNQSMTIELYGSIASTATNGSGAADTLISYLRVSGITAQSGTSVYADNNSDTDNTDAGSTGQTITAGAGTLTSAMDASNPVAANNEDNKTFTAAAVKFTGANDSFTISELTVTLSGATTVSNVIVKADGTTVATRAGSTSMTISGLSIAVPSNGTKVVTIDLQLASVGSGAGTSGEDVKASISGYKATNSSGTQVTQADESGFATRAGQSQFVYAAIPTLAEQTIPNVDPTGTVEIAKWAVTANGGAVSVKQFGVNITITEGDADATLVAGTFRLFRDGTDISSEVGIVNVAGATIEATNTLGEGSAVAYILFANEEQINTSRTYSLRTTLGGAWETGDSIRAELNSDAVAGSTIKYLDGVAGTSAAVAELVTSAGASDTGVLNFIWSDVSAIPHNFTVTDDTTPTSSGDWANGYLVKSLPLTNWTLTY